MERVEETRGSVRLIPRKLEVTTVCLCCRECLRQVAVRYRDFDNVTGIQVINLLLPYLEFDTFERSAMSLRLLFLLTSCATSMRRLLASSRVEMLIVVCSRLGLSVRLECLHMMFASFSPSLRSGVCEKFPGCGWNEEMSTDTTTLHGIFIFITVKPIIASSLLSIADFHSAWSLLSHEQVSYFQLSFLSFDMLSLL